MLCGVQGGGSLAVQRAEPADRSSLLARSLRRRGRGTPSRAPRRSGLPIDPRGKHRATLRILVEEVSAGGSVRTSQESIKRPGMFRWTPTCRFRSFQVATWGVEGIAWPAVSWRWVRVRCSAVPWPPLWQSSWRASSLRRRPWPGRPSRPLGSPGRGDLLRTCVPERKRRSCGARNVDNRGEVRHRCRGPAPRGVPGTRRLDSWERRARGWSAGTGGRNPDPQPFQSAASCRIDRDRVASKGLLDHRRCDVVR